MAKKLFPLIIFFIFFQDVFGNPEFEFVRPIRPAVIKNVEKYELGKKLFFDRRLSKSGHFSCYTCHNLSLGGSSNLETFIGHEWAKGHVNPPTLLNSTASLAMSWDGRTRTQKEQVIEPITHPYEMASTHELALETINAIPGYVEEFKKVYQKSPITFEEISDALAVFEATLVTPNSRFDQWLNGNKNAITPTEIEGYRTFKRLGCISCHNGELLGGTSYQKMGVFIPYATKNDYEGRIRATGNPRERNYFKVPTLRNIELTYPYFHDGSTSSLKEAIEIMARNQLTRVLTEDEKNKIIAFFKTLTGEQPKIVLPLLPPSNEHTPKPLPFKE